MTIARFTGIGMVLATLAILSGCNGNLEAENEMLLEENQELRAQLDDRNVALESATERTRDRERRLAEARRELDQLRRQREEQEETERTGFEGIEGVTGSRSAGRVTASIESDVLFAPGSADLTGDAKRSLDQVISVLRNEYAGRTIRVDGHTDSDPIRVSPFDSNYHLGFERAFSVREYFIEQGLPGDRIHLASYGPDRPRDTKEQSRRVEIVVVLDE